MLAAGLMPDQISEQGTHTFPRSDWHWPRVVATEIIQLSGGNVFVNLGFLKKTSEKQLIILTTKIHLHCDIFTFDLFFGHGHY